ncbi:MAG: hypothetical protein Q9196_001082 [Gyalolechia fulgens]
MARKSGSIDLKHPLPELSIKQHSSMPSHPPHLLHHPSSPRKNKVDQIMQTSSSPSSKQGLEELTHRLLLQATCEDKSYLEDKFDSVDPVKFSPDNNGARVTMTSINPYDKLDRSPSHEERFTRIDDLLREYEKANPKASPTTPRYQPTKYQHKPKGMSHSFSENNTSFRRNDGHGQMSAGSLQMQQPGRYDAANAMSGYGSETTPFACARGRLPNRTTSPIKGLEDIKEDQTPEGRYSYNAHKDLPADPPASPTKRSRSPMKQLFGENGFLGRSTSMKELPSEDYRKRGVKHLGEKLKQRVEGMTEGVSKLIPTSISHGELSKLIPASMSSRESPSKSGSAPVASTFPVSLSPPEQARFYSEAELMICATANQYLTIQKEQGRMSYESVAKILSFWAQKNRPQVIGFMFDQLTQRDLVLQNLKTFRFYGPNAENPMSMNAMMNSWKTLAKEMSVRTFCTGDSTIRKQIQDIYKILELLGAPMVTFMAFQQIQVRVLKIMREQQKVRDEQEATKYGVERKWEPPGGFGPRNSTDSEAYINPFSDEQ